MYLLIDDTRNIHCDLICRTAESGIEALMKNEVTHLYLDHDLGVGKTGYDVVLWLEQSPAHRPKAVTLVTNNPAGRQNIERALLSMGYLLEEGTWKL